jgi:hypothetical protein
MGKFPTLRLRPGRRYFYAHAAFIGTLALASLVLALTADRLVQPQHRAGRTWLKTGLFGAAGLALFSVGFVLASDPNRYYLELTPEGFTERLLALRRTRLWRDIEGFEADHDDGPHVAFRYSDDYRRRISPWWARSRLAAWGRLLGTYGKTADDLSGLLNEWRDRYVAKPGVTRDPLDDWP